MLGKLGMGFVALVLAGAAFAHTADSLKSAVQAIHKANAAGDAATAAKLTADLLPDEARIKKGAREDADAALVAAVVDMHKKITPPPDRFATIMQPTPKHTEVRVHAATTEEIVAYEKGSVAFNEFPGGAKKLAAGFLKPKTTWYEVEVVEPGRPKGTRFHLFFWDGAKWTMMGPAWRVLK
jgi:hypothetical protein